MFRRKPTFAFFLAVLFALGAPMLAATNPWLAESKGLSILKAELPPCTLTSPAQNRSFTVRDCTTKISCASTGTETVRLVCDGTEWRAINATATAVDLGDYVLITKAGQQTRTATGAGNDITDTATDDIIHVANDYSGTFAATWSAIATVFSFSGGDFSAQSADTGSSINVQDQNVELTSDGEISFQGPTRMNDGTAPAVACSVQMKGIFYFDTDINKACICNGTDYVLMNDDTTTTGCS